MEYASSVWSPHQIENKNDLEMVQRRAARRICKDFSRDTSGAALVQKLKLEELEQRRDAGRVTMMYKIMNDEVSVHPRPGTLTQATRSRVQHGLLVPHTRTNVRLHSFFPVAVRMWNSLPTTTATAPSEDAFKSALEGWSY